MLKKLVLSSFFVILILSNICFAQGNWMITSGGCKVWNPAPEEGETASWAGQCQNGLVQGHGVIKWFKFGQIGNEVEADYDKGRSYGNEIVRYPDGSIYEGLLDPINGNRSGQGTLTRPSGKVQSGIWVNGSLSSSNLNQTTNTAYPACQGQNPRSWDSCVGSYTFPNGNIYYGEWKRGLREGYGSLRVVVIGESDDNSIRFKTPGVYKGQFSNGRLNGFGIILYDNGEQFQVEVLNNKIVNAKQASPSNSNQTTNTQQNQPKTANENSIMVSGTAWQVSSTQLVTAFHVVENAKSIGVAIGDDVEMAKVIASDQANDIALLQLTGKPLTTKALPLAAKGPKLGSRVAVIGYPLADILGVQVQATSGEISKLAGIGDDLRFYQISAAIQEGNSGGPLIDAQGQVLGVVSSKLNDLTMLKRGIIPQNVSFAVKYPYIQAMLDSAGIQPVKPQKKIIKIEDAITESKDSVYLLIVKAEK